MGSQWGTVQGPPRKWTLKGLSLLSEEPTAWRLLLAQICRRRDGPSPVSLALEGVGEAEALVGAAAALCSCGFSAIIWGRLFTRGEEHACGSAGSSRVLGTHSSPPRAGPRVPQLSSLKQGT